MAAIVGNICAIAYVIARPEIHSLVDSLKTQLPQTSEPFVWSAIDLQSITAQLPDSIRSCWIFVAEERYAVRLSLPSKQHSTHAGG